MIRAALPRRGTAEAWRAVARLLASHRIAPGHIAWELGDGAADLFAKTSPPAETGPYPVGASKSFAALAGHVVAHSDPERFALSYEALIRHQDDRLALGNPADPLTRRLDVLAKSVRRDIHKMHAFVRFRELPSSGPRRRFGAWFEPEHLILEAATPFFAKRFTDMDWMIATPEGVARFADGALTYEAPVARPDLPDDASETLWATYFANIFNPARVKISAMKSEMPLKYWKNLPETRMIPAMLAGAEQRVAAMRAALPTEAPSRAARILARTARAPLPEMPVTLDSARQAAAGCTRCDLCRHATQTVWGEGDPSAPLMIVGEQPGDHEDLAGRPFVGPAGQVLRQLLKDVGQPKVWMTNAVKHFKFTPRGKRRLHQNPNQSEIDHCRWWLDLERKMIAPRLTLALGGSAAYGLTGRAGAVGKRRGLPERALDGGPVLITWHPSYILRLNGSDAAAARGGLRDDLAQAVEMAGAA